MNKRNLKRGMAFTAALILLCAVFGAFVKFTVDDNKKITEFAVTASADDNASVVYMTEDISPEGLVKIYEKMNFDDTGKTAVKISTGESQNSNNLAPDLIKDLVQSVDGTIVECNTAYGGNRSTTAKHWQEIEQRGYKEIADVDLMDEEGETEIPIKNGTRITSDYVGSHLGNYDNLICLSHFKGHAMAGYGGAIKNMSIGIATSKGKVWIHSGGTRTSGSIFGDQDPFLEAMGDATSGVIDYMNGRVVYINVMNNLSIDCDCDGNPAAPTIHDMGILASYDPVALDKACLDLIYNHESASDEDTSTFINRVESRNGLYTLEHAEEIGIGTRHYKIESLDGEQTNEYPSVTMSYADGKVTIDGLKEKAKLICASYTGGVLSGVRVLDAINGDNDISSAIGTYTRVFLWDGIDTLVPLHDSISAGGGDA